MGTDIQTACTRHCGDGCALIVTRQEDGAIALRGNPTHPFTCGLMCAKTAQFARRLNSLRRIVTPLVRIGGKFHQATWDDALDIIAEKIQTFHEAPQRILHIMGPASFGLLYKASKLLFGQLGASSTRGALCLAAGAEAQKRDFGEIRQGPLNDISRASRIVNWGRNVTRHSVHLTSFVQQARKNGAQVLSIHPGDSGYASVSDMHRLHTTR
jgi:anaerobic selenocysteine-containing dehydrogenase